MMNKLYNNNNSVNNKKKINKGKIMFCYLCFILHYTLLHYTFYLKVTSKLWLTLCVYLCSDGIPHQI